MNVSVSRGQGWESTRMPVHSWLAKWSMWGSVFRGIPLFSQEYCWRKGNYELIHRLLASLYGSYGPVVYIYLSSILFHLSYSYSIISFCVPKFITLKSVKQKRGGEREIRVCFLLFSLETNYTKREFYFLSLQSLSSGYGCI